MELAARSSFGAGALARLASVDIAVLYFWPGLLAVALLAFLTPAFLPPDEGQHFFRAWQLSELNVRGVVQGDAAGAMLPAAIVEFADRAQDAFKGGSSLPGLAPLARDGSPVDMTDRKFARFTEASSYSPLPYAPQIVAFAAGRALGLGPPALLRLARLCNGLCALLIVACALRILPNGRWFLFIAALLPMTLLLFASVSPDAAVISCSFLFTAVAARATARARWTGRDVAVAFLTGLAVCSLKPFYAPLLALGLVAALKPGATKRILPAHAALLLLVPAMTAAWLFVGAVGVVPRYEDVDAGAQFFTLVHDPLRFVAVALNTIWIECGVWLLFAIGFSGSGVLFFPSIMYVLPFLAMAALFAVPREGEPELAGVDFAWRLLLAAACTTLICAALYLVITPADSPVIRGIQGRYFLPLAAVAATLLSVVHAQERARLATAARALLAGACCVMLLSVLAHPFSARGLRLDEITGGRQFLPLAGLAVAALAAIRPPTLPPALLRSVVILMAIVEALMTPLVFASIRETV